MSLSRIDFELPVDDEGRDAAIVGFNVDGEMRWTIEAGRNHHGDLTQVEGLSAEQVGALVEFWGRFMAGGR